VVLEDEIKEVATSLGFEYLICSAKESAEGPERAFRRLAELVRARTPTSAQVIPTAALCYIYHGGAVAFPADISRPLSLPAGWARMVATLHRSSLGANWAD